MTDDAAERLGAALEEGQRAYAAAMAKLGVAPDRLPTGARAAFDEMLRRRQATLKQQEPVDPEK